MSSVVLRREAAQVGDDAPGGFLRLGVRCGGERLDFLLAGRLVGGALVGVPGVNEDVPGEAEREEVADVLRRRAGDAAEEDRGNSHCG